MCTAPNGHTSSCAHNCTALQRGGAALRVLLARWPQLVPIPQCSVRGGQPSAHGERSDSLSADARQAAAADDACTPREHLAA
eukprot:2271485-Prymnesium_polylepis.1